MFRVTSRSEAGACTIELEGRLTGLWVEELRRTIQGGGDAGTRVRLGLSGLAFADQAGVNLLRELRDGGAELIDCSEFLAALVDGGAGWL